MTHGLQDVVDVEIQRNTCRKTVLPVMLSAGSVTKRDILQRHAGQGAVSMTLHSCSREVMSRRVLLSRRNVLKRSQ